MIRGYDLSQHQATTPPLAGLGFVILRASIGTTKDTRYDQHYAAARAAGLVTMAYHYGYAASQAPIADQAALFLQVAADADFLWLDQEATGFDDTQAQQFIDAVRKVRPCGLYHSSCAFGGVNADAKWVADWRDASEAAGYPRTCDGAKEFPGWDLWQYDGGGADGLDNDYWNPASPIAGLLRRGYVTEKFLEVAEAARDAAEADLAAKDAEIVSLHDANLALTAQLAETTADLAAAPAIERDRIAAAEAERIKAL